jgi:type I restriction enzyme R subunit
MKKEKSTAAKFGGLIDIYAIDQAVKDGAVVPLLYEGRHVEQEVNSNGIDTWFERVSKDLTPDPPMTFLSTTRRTGRAPDSRPNSPPDPSVRLCYTSGRWTRSAW